jgi:cell division inhibitor SulA
MPANSELARLLEHPAIWRGTSVAHAEVLPTGFGVLDERLPGKGWPRSGLIEILVPHFGVGELSLLLPTLAALTRRPMARWCVWVAPPLEPFAPALAAHGIALERVLVVREPVADAASTPGTAGNYAKVAAGLWAFEQALGSGACDVVMAWMQHPRARDIRRLQLAAERGRALGVLFRPQQAARHSSHATLRLTLETTARGVRATLLKSRGGIRGPVEFELHASRS